MAGNLTSFWGGYSRGQVWGQKDGPGKRGIGRLKRSLAEREGTKGEVPEPKVGANVMETEPKREGGVRKCSAIASHLNKIVVQEAHRLETVAKKETNSPESLLIGFGNRRYDAHGKKALGRRKKGEEKDCVRKP